jgi:hypothetical protein
MKQPSHPAVGDRGGHHASWFTSTAKAGSQLGPAQVVAGQAVGGFDQHGPKLRIARFDQTSVRLALSAGSIGRDFDCTD